MGMITGRVALHEACLCCKCGALVPSGVPVSLGRPPHSPLSWQAYLRLLVHSHKILLLRIPALDDNLEQGFMQGWVMFCRTRGAGTSASIVFCAMASVNLCITGVQPFRQVGVTFEACSSVTSSAHTCPALGWMKKQVTGPKSP